ncbi:hypothetical protein [Burkholderia ubonensis]|uniref:hypothetical protein n=1 Tax=Burkholderia ubonensis TaxID=101571 RepID=UPI000AD19479|nr:hypothetical protein [Burkholderia ubonensis]
MTYANHDGGSRQHRPCIAKSAASNNPAAIRRLERRAKRSARGSRVGLARRSMPAHVSTNGILKLGIGASGINMTYSAGYGYSW